MNSQETSLAVNNNDVSPVFVDVEEMFEKMAEVTNETARKAFELFQARNGEAGSPIDDWFKAESTLLKQTPVEIAETADAVNVRAEVPGFKPDEIEVSVKDNILILSGETKSEEKREAENTVYSEYRSNRFCRQLTLPAEVETDGVAATVKDGILQMSLRKKVAISPEKIAVKAA